MGRTRSESTRFTRESEWTYLSLASILASVDGQQKKADGRGQRSDVIMCVSEGGALARVGVQGKMADGEDGG